MIKGKQSIAFEVSPYLEERASVVGKKAYLNVVELPYERREAALRPAREKTLRFIYYIQTELGYRNLGIADDEFDTPDGLAYLPYHREGRRAEGVVMLTFDDVTTPMR